MSDIQPGDVVVCIEAHENTCPFGGGPLRDVSAGRYYLVSAVSPTHQCDDVFLVGVRIPVCPGLLRKIDAADEQFTALIRACKPINTPVSA